MSAIVIKDPTVSISPKILNEIKEQHHAQGQVVLHFIYFPVSMDSLIRIWPSTYLYDTGSSHKSELVHVENITIYPEWYPCTIGRKHFFTLVFSGLPKSCTTFDFIEHCSNEGGAFKVYGIERNDADVYYLHILG